MNLAPVAPVPATVHEMSILESSAIEASEMTAGTAAVVELFSLASIVSKVENTVAPFSLMSKVGIPLDETAFTEALTLVSVNPNGARNV